MERRSIAREKPKVAPRPRVLRVNGATGMENCFTWITRSGENLQVSTPKPLQPTVLSSCEFLNFTTVLGPARQGKSFLMNCLLGNSVFGTSDNIGVCTKAVQIASVVREVWNGGCSLFVDTEGQGDEDVGSDTILLTPVILLSKVILFNWKGGLQKNQILHELAIFVEVSNCVSSDSFKDSTSKFGHLHVVLRDFHFQGTAKDAFAIIFNEESKRGEKVKQRNKIREKLLSSFESIEVCIIPVPCEDIQNLNLSATSAKFQKSVKELKVAILRQMRQPRRFGTVVINSQNVDVLVRKFVKELEDGDMVHVKSAISQLQRGVVDQAKRKFQETLIKTYKEIHVPLRDGLEWLLVQKRDALLDAFIKSTAKVDLEAVYRDNILTDLHRFANRELDGKRKENRLVAQIKIAEQSKILGKAEKLFRLSIESKLRNCPQGSREMQQRLLEREKRLVYNFLKTTANLDWIPEQRAITLEELKTLAFNRQEEMVRAKQKEEEYEEKSEHQARLSKAADDFRLEFESNLRRNQEISTSNVSQTFYEEKERLINIFRKRTDGLHRISHELREEELVKVKYWAEMRIKEKLEAAEKEKGFLEREQKLSRELATVQAQSLPVQQVYPNPPLSTCNTPPAALFSSIPVTPPSESRLKFYKGGQFTPGGGRAPKGGCYMSPNSGPCSRSSGSSAMSFGSSSSGGQTFYKGGQFTPGGGRAPKGGCWK